MKTIITAMFTCLLLFGISAGATRFLYQSADAESADAEEKSATDESSEESAEDSDDALPIMQVSLRPDSAVSVEAVMQMSDSIKRMEQDLIQREQRLRKKEQNLSLVFEDLAREKEELDALGQGVETKIKRLTELNDQLAGTLKQLESEKLELEKLNQPGEGQNDSPDQEIAATVNNVKSWFANLEADVAANYLKEFSNNGKMELAAALLQKMPDRQKSKILSSMNDPILVDQLIEALSTGESK